MTIPTDLASSFELIRQHGPAVYTIVFSFAFSHSMLFTLFAGYAASTGALSPAPLITSAFLGSFLGDVVRFWIGRRYGNALLRRFPRLQRGIDTVVRLTAQNSAWMILTHRYPHGLRGIAAIAYGMTEMSWLRFMILNAVAAGIWALLVVAVGYSYGALSEATMNGVSNGIGLAALVLFAGLSWVMSRRLESAVAKAAEKT